MPRYKLTIEYDGTLFCGWQRQTGQRSVQQVIEEAFAAYGQETITLHGSGRTDGGVHASGQVAHFDSSRTHKERQLPLALNAHLNSDVSILKAEQVSDHFDARRHAAMRHYEYTILNRRARPARLAASLWHVPFALQVSLMQNAAATLIGHHDFSSFRATGCQASSPLRTLDELTVNQHGSRLIIHAAARSFLYRQVRIMVGTLIDIGRGHLPADAMPHILAQKNRRAAGQTAPPQGLCLTAIQYSHNQKG